MCFGCVSLQRDRAGHEYDQVVTVRPPEFLFSLEEIENVSVAHRPVGFDYGRGGRRDPTVGRGHRDTGANRSCTPSSVANLMVVRGKASDMPIFALSRGAELDHTCPLCTSQPFSTLDTDRPNAFSELCGKPSQQKAPRQQSAPPHRQTETPSYNASASAAPRSPYGTGPTGRFIDAAVERALGHTIRSTATLAAALPADAGRSRTRPKITSKNVFVKCMSRLPRCNDTTNVARPLSSTEVSAGPYCRRPPLSFGIRGGRSGAARPLLRPQNRPRSQRRKPGRHFRRGVTSDIRILNN